MKKLFVSLLLLVTCTSTAFAADKVGDHCKKIGFVSQVSGKLMSCVDGKWKSVGTTPITLNVQLADGSKSLTNMSVTTLNGQPAPISIGSDHTYVASAKKEGDKVTVTPGVVHEGVSMTLTPTLAKDGKIEVELVVVKDDLAAINKDKHLEGT